MLNKNYFKKTDLFFLLLSQIIFVGMLCFSMVGEARVKKLELEKLQDGKDLFGGCGCSILNSKSETIMFAGVDASRSALVRVNGEAMTLPLISSTEKQNTTAKVGDTFEKLYGDKREANGNTSSEKKGLQLRLQYKVTAVCAPHDESCEVTRYSVDGQISIGAKRGEFKSLKGDCGC